MYFPAASRCYLQSENTSALEQWFSGVFVFFWFDTVRI
jgi:hypothetical protein